MQKKNLLFSTVKIYYTNYRSIVRYSDSWKHQIKNDLSKRQMTDIRVFYSTSTHENDILLKDFWDSFDIELKKNITLDNEGYNVKAFELLEQYERLPYYKHLLKLQELDWSINGGKDPTENIPNSLYKLEEKIEDLSYSFDESNVFRETPNLIKKLILPTKDTAQTYLNKKLTDETSLRTINIFGVYTIEAIILYVLGIAFSGLNNTSMVRLSTLLSLLQRNVITQARIINKMQGSREDTICSPLDSKEPLTKNNLGTHYEISRKLVEFMIDRDVISIEHITADKPVVIEKGSAYIEKNLFVICNFDVNLLPIKMNLPMVVPPVDWHVPTEKYEGIELGKGVLSDLQGGYLFGPNVIYDQGSNIITSKNLTNFNIQLHPNKYKEMCTILNGLQKQPFKINSKLLEFLLHKRPTLEKEGLLTPEILSRVNLKEAFDFLREYYFHKIKKNIKIAFTLDYLLKELAIRVQKARFEDFILKIALAYKNYIFYLPAFMDFRGRIYRAGMLHFHERDLARGLILFDNNHEECKKSMDIVSTSAAFKYKKFDHYYEARQWYRNIRNSQKNFMDIAKGASEPFQFMAKAMSLRHEGGLEKMPITQDATASAYQIMSYLLLNEEMATRTNLIPHPSGKIQDVYTGLLHDFKKYLNSQFYEKREIIESKLNRKLIKSLFMPMIYGKTVIAMEQDIHKAYGQLLSREDTHKMASLCKEFFKKTYPDIANLMKLITHIGWFCSTLDRPVKYSIPYFTTKQDYMAFVKENINVYEKSTKQRRRVTLSIATDTRDWRKTQTATCANLIHQKDAYIAMKVVESLLSHRADIYTVHDNFITTTPFAHLVPDIYIKVFIEMGNPIHIIDRFIRDNIITPYEYDDGRPYIPLSEVPIPSGPLSDFLVSLSPSKKNSKTWYKNVDDFISCYKHYVETVCGKPVSDYNSNKDPSIDVKWNKFKQQLENRSHNYSVHY